MLKRIVLFTLAVSSGCAILYAQQSTVTIPLGKTQADSGQQMYVSYCASCHGIDGRGNGQVAMELKVPPADLTSLSKNNHGAYPATHITSALGFGAETPWNGNKGMCPGNLILNKVDGTYGWPLARYLRVYNMTRYLESMQAK